MVESDKFWVSFITFAVTSRLAVDAVERNVEPLGIERDME